MNYHNLTHRENGASVTQAVFYVHRDQLNAVLPRLLDTRTRFDVLPVGLSQYSLSVEPSQAGWLSVALD